MKQEAGKEETTQVENRFLIIDISSSMMSWHSLVSTYESDFPLNIPTLKICALDGLVGSVQLPGDAKIGAEDDQTGEEGAEYRQGHDEGGVVQ